jgi:hypothetical protein
MITETAMAEEKIIFLLGLFIQLPLFRLACRQKPFPYSLFRLRHGGKPPGGHGKKPRRKTQL